MKKKEKLVILVLLVITIALVVVGIVTKKNNNTKIADSNANENNSSEVPSLYGENVITLEDGTKLNTSKELNKEKTIDGMTLTEIQLTEKANMTMLLATLTNKSDSTKGGYVANITLIDEEGKEITTLHPYIDELAAGESTQLQASTSLDFANAYNLKIEKQ